MQKVHIFAGTPCIWHALATPPLVKDRILA